ncbi:fungal-specific transcription factor domain-containing protein [Thelonectria olida]|uniref:Fungal-specific transcription factor domain-containing protein n=1 Tax=Thelonectria olida TaxID=1576542 RepID=A0A9P9AJ38_9HYPO|nr:fungal-specific transcription factor domain-containing protein [Thelonectria olida]
MANKGCGTCRARKVLCDRTVPTCRRCADLGRECLGYGLRLSWPRESDRRRAIQGPTPPAKAIQRKSRHGQLINVFPWDIEMQPYFSEETTDYKSLARLADRIAAVARSKRLGAPFPQPSGLPIAYAHSNLTFHEKELLQYFVSVSSRSLKAFDQSAVDIRKVILRMALSDGALASTAVLRAAIALASLHRDGPGSNALKCKVSALRALSDTMRGGIDQPQSFQHIAAGMLLCSYEVQADSATSSHWLWYTCGSKSIVKASKLDESTAESDFASLIGWVQYFDVLARFSLRHWRRHRAGDVVQVQGLGFAVTSPTVCSEAEGGRLKILSHELLALLSEVCDNVLEPSNPEYHTDDYKSYIRVLEWKLRRIRVIPSDIDDIEPAIVASWRVLELFRLATLIYVVRSSEGATKASTKLDAWIETAFAIMSQVDACQSPFPLLILGCEADSDERRMVWLELVSKTKKATHPRDLEFVTAIMQAVWAQDDLAEEGLDYAHKLHVIFSSNEIVPALV